MRWSNVDLAHGYIEIRDESGHSQVDNAKRRSVKSGRSRRLPIHAELLAILGARKERTGEIFAGPRGGRLKPDTVRNILRRGVLAPLADRFPSPEEERGFVDGRLHSFRHFFASTCANQGIPERVVMEWLGHQDSAMVRHYYHLHDAESRRQIAQLPALGAAGQQLAGQKPRAATTEEENLPSPESSGATAP